MLLHQVQHNYGMCASATGACATTCSAATTAVLQVEETEVISCFLQAIKRHRMGLPR